MSLNIYAPRDERFGHLKLADFLAYALKSIGQFLKPEIEDLFDSTRDEFDSFEDVLKLYEGGVEVPEALLKNVRDNIPAEMLKEIFRTDGERFLKFPIPQVIKGMFLSLGLFILFFILSCLYKYVRNCMLSYVTSLN